MTHNTQPTPTDPHPARELGLASLELAQGERSGVLATWDADLGSRGIPELSESGETAEPSKGRSLTRRDLLPDDPLGQDDAKY